MVHFVTWLEVRVWHGTERHGSLKGGIPTTGQTKWGLSPCLVPEPISQPHLAKQEFPCCSPAMSKDRGGRSVLDQPLVESSPIIALGYRRFFCHCRTEEKKNQAALSEESLCLKQRPCSVFWMRPILNKRQLSWRS